jgi:hypothetical protein
MLSLSQLSQKKASSISYITIVQTNDDRAGSIAGLTYAAKILNVRFEIERANVSYKECWLSTTKKYNEKELLSQQSLGENIVKLNDKYWNYKSGYGDYILTEKGVHEIKYDFKSMGKNKRRQSWGRNLIDKIVSTIKLIVQKIRNLFNWDNT